MVAQLDAALQMPEFEEMMARQGKTWERRSCRRIKRNVESWPLRIISKVN